MAAPSVNAMAELKDPKRAANAIALRFKEVRRQWFRALLVRAGVADPDGLSLQLSRASATTPMIRRCTEFAGFPGQLRAV